MGLLSTCFTRASKTVPAGHTRHALLYVEWKTIINGSMTKIPNDKTTNYQTSTEKILNELDIKLTQSLIDKTSPLAKLRMTKHEIDKIWKMAEHRIEKILQLFHHPKIDPSKLSCFG